jgi:hypothetical protein
MTLNEPIVIRNRPPPLKRGKVP